MGYKSKSNSNPKPLPKLVSTLDLVEQEVSLTR